jgi:hypothetical protein
VFVGIDVAKCRLEDHVRPSGERFALDHDDEGVATLVGCPAAIRPAPGARLRPRSRPSRR